MDTSKLEEVSGFPLLVLILNVLLAGLFIVLGIFTDVDFKGYCIGAIGATIFWIALRYYRA